MFKDAYAIATKFTAPVVLSRQTINGKCFSTIGSYVILNDEGWALTAFHILKLWQDLEQAEAVAKAHEQAVKAVENDASLSAGQRKQKLKGLQKLPQGATRRASAWWGRNGMRMVFGGGIEAIDLGLCRFEPFDKSWFQAYPEIKDPDKDYEPGRSLCKLGFPFHRITPTWHEDRNVFELPPGSVPLPLFPIEGMVTRFVDVVATAGKPALPFPMRLLETSSPGLRGQSGGPTFDAKGTLWAIQTKTGHFPLDFDPAVGGHKEHQFLNVGYGVHAATIIGLLEQQGVKYQKSAY